MDGTLTRIGAFSDGSLGCCVEGLYGTRVEVRDMTRREARSETDQDLSSTCARSRL